MKHQTFALLLSLTFIINLAISQEVKILSSENNEAIDQVLITNQKQKITAISNNFGIADLSKFNSEDTLFCQHAAYNAFIISYSEAVQKGIIHLIPKEIKLNEIVISAIKWEENIEEIPNRIDKIELKSIAFENPQTSADLLKNTPGVYIQKSQQGGGSPMIRGFAANSILLVFDGIRMNNSIYRSGNLQNIITIDPLALSSSEVIFGPGTMVYGSDAMGGVIDFHSKTIELNTEKGLLAHGQAFARYSSGNNEKTGHVDLTLSNQKWGSFTSFTFNDFGEQTMGSFGPRSYEQPFYVERIDGTDQMIRNEDTNLQKYTAYSQINILQKVKFQATEKLNLEYLFYFTTSSNIDRYDRLIQMNGDVLKYAEWYYGPQKWMVNSLKINDEKPSFLYDAFKFQINYQDYQENRSDRRFGNTDLNSRTDHVGIVSANADFNKKFSPDFFFFYGLEATHDHLVSSAFTKNIVTGELSPLSTRYPDGKNTYQTIAAYSAFRYKLNRKMDFSGGLRYNFIDLNVNFIDKTFFPFDYDAIHLQNDALTASLGLVYRSDKKTRINLNLSTGFRSPNIDDIAKVFDSEPGNVVVPNPELKPEYIYNADLGIKQTAFDSKLEVELVAFFSYLDQAMVRSDFTINGSNTIIYDGQESNVQAIVNTGFARIYGVTFDYSYHFSKMLFWKSSFTRISGSDNDGFSIRHAPPLYGKSSINFENNQWKVQLNAFYNGEIAFEDLAPTEADKPDLYAVDENGNPYSPAWFTVNFRSAYQLSNALNLQFEFENILDKRYRTYSSGVAAAGRSFRLSLRYHF